VHLGENKRNLRRIERKSRRVKFFILSAMRAGREGRGGNIPCRCDSRDPFIGLANPPR
jgi:hypothetical protein